MIITGRSKLTEFRQKHADSRKPLIERENGVQNEQWTNSQQIKNRYSSVSFRSDNKVIFNIGGNKYRLFVLVSYAAGVVNIEWIGTHAEYGRKNFQPKELKVQKWT